MYKNIKENIYYVGVNDIDLKLFEGQFPVPHGMAYNSYVVRDEKTAVIDTVDVRRIDDFLENLDDTLEGHAPDYLVIQHVEPDHASGFGAFLEKYPDTQLVGNEKTFKILENYFNVPKENRVVVADGDSLSLGKTTLNFIFAPLVHWPEVMMTYESYTKTFFSADAFGKFGVLDYEEPWADEARRYYFNIVGRFGLNVSRVLDKIRDFPIDTICSLHGPVLEGAEKDRAIELYKNWSAYKADTNGVFIAYCSMHGNMKKAAEKMEVYLNAIGIRAEAINLSEQDLSYAVAGAFRYDTLLLAAPSYYGKVMPVMEDFLSHLAGRAFQNRKVCMMEGGSWAPSAKRTMLGLVEQMKDITVKDPIITITGAYIPEKNNDDLKALALSF